MPKPLDLGKVVATNPKVDTRKLKEGLDAMKVLRERGLSGAKYNLVLPFTRKHSVREGK